LLEYWGRTQISGSKGLDITVRYSNLFYLKKNLIRTNL